MKITATVKSDIDITAIRVSAEVRYWEDAEINGISDDADNPKIPLRNGKIWEPTIDIDTGRVRDWPTGTTADVHYKVCDQGIYELLDNSGNVVAKKDGYVPDILNFGNGYGDYIILNIGADGVITNWIAAIDPEEWKWSAPAAPAAPAASEQDALDAARWRFVRKKLCLTGNGNGTCAMQTLNLPANIAGWPEVGKVAEFCDAAIDAAIAAKAAHKEITEVH